MTAPLFDVIVLRSDADAVVQVFGEVDVQTAPMLRDRLASLIDEGARDLTLDLAALDFIDSTGLSVLVSALRRVRQAGGELTVRALQPSTLRLFEITGLTEVFSIARQDSGEEEGAAQEMR